MISTMITRIEIQREKLRNTIDIMLRNALRAFFSVCMNCGFCNNVCPVYRATKNPKYTPLRRVITAKKLLEGQIDKEAASDVLFSCLLCGACSSACPFGLDIYRIIYLARCKLALEGYGPSNFAKMAEGAAKTLHSFGVPVEQALREIRSDELEGFIDRKDCDVLYVPSPVETAFMPRHVYETASILKLLGINWTISRRVIDCGGNIGVDASRPDVGLKILLNLLNVAEELGVDKVALGACGADYKWISLSREIIDELGIDTPRITFTSIYELIAKRLKTNKLLKKKDEVVLHDPCSMTRYIRVDRSYKSIIPYAKKPRFSGACTLCCGGGGGLSLRKDSFARNLLLSIASKRVEQLGSVSSNIVTPCIKCYISFRTAVLRKRLVSKIRIEGLSSYIVKKLKEEDTY